MLFNPIHDPSQTQFAYRLRYWPANDLLIAATKLITWSRRMVHDKESLEAMLDETNNYYLFDDPKTGRLREYKIVWLYNNIPTEDEYARMESFNIELRASPVFPEYGLCILSARAWKEGNKE